MAVNSGNALASSIRLLAGNYGHAAAGLSPAERSKLASQFARSAGSASITAEQQSNLTKILTFIVKDVEIEVRRALATAAANNVSFPHDIAVQLAADIDDVAVPVLEASSVLTDTDILEIIEKHPSLLKMTAIARRPEVSETISSALVEADNVDVVTVLLDNAGARISDHCFEDIIGRYADLPPIQKKIIDRDELPAAAIVKLVPRITHDLINRLVERHRVPVDLARSLALETQHRATLGLATGLSTQALDNLIDELIIQDAVTAPLLMRALCAGSFDFFCRVLSVMTLNSVNYVANRIKESPQENLPTIWRNASLPERWLPAICAAISVITSGEPDSSKLDAIEYKSRLIEEVTAQLDVLDVKMSREEWNHIFSQPTGSPSGVSGLA